MKFGTVGQSCRLLHSDYLLFVKPMWYCRHSRSVLVPEHMSHLDTRCKTFHEISSGHCAIGGLSKATALRSVSEHNPRDAITHCVSVQELNCLLREDKKNTISERILYQGPLSLFRQLFMKVALNNLQSWRAAALQLVSRKQWRALLSAITLRGWNICHFASH